MSAFRQCAATRQNGERCRRVAREGSQYCHTHRRHASQQAHRPSTPAERLQQHCFQCEDCGRLQPPGQILAVDDGKTLLCEPCFRLRCQIEARIDEIVNEKPRCACEICADLERFGVDRDLTEAAIKRMLADKRLVNNSKEAKQ